MPDGASPGADENGRFSGGQAVRDALERDGYVVIPAALSPDELAPAIDELAAMYPSAAQFHDAPDAPEHARFANGQFGGLELLPFDSIEWSRLAVHPRLIGIARLALGTDDVRLYQAEAWAKYSSAADYDQLLHRDYPNHTLVVPTDDARFGHIEMFLYLNGATLDTGPTFAVSHRHSRDVGAASARLGRDEAPELYRLEVPVVGPPGTLLVYLPSTFHRGSAMRRPRAARYTMHLNWRTAATEWAGRRGWGNTANQPVWARLVESLTSDQLSVFGFPRPGHPYWTDDTIRGVQARYPGLDMVVWREAVHRAR